MKISIYSTAFNVIEKNFDYKDAIRNFLYYADEVCLAVNTSKDKSLEVLTKYVKDNNFNVKIIPTEFDYEDPFCYGKIVNAALQGCTGDICILQDFDERFGGDKKILNQVCEQFLKFKEIKALFVPVINLYGDFYHYKDIGFKWYIHKRGLYRGAVDFGVKENGRPDYDKTSTDELIDENKKLVPTINILEATRLFDMNQYIKNDYPFVYHLGYTNFDDRIKRNSFWKPFWEKATGGDKNSHSLNKNDLYVNDIKPTNLKLWKKI